MADDKKISIAQYYDSLSRVFKGGTPLVRTRIANKVQSPGEISVPIGTAKAFLKSVSNTYTSQLASYGQYSRLARYSDYNEMESMSEIGAALDIYSEEVCCRGEFGEIIRIESSNLQIKKALMTLFYDTLNIEFNAPLWVRNMCKYGDQFLLVDHHPDYGILNCLPLPVNEVEREEGYDKEEPFAHRFRWVTQGNRTLRDWEIIHFRLLGNDGFLPYGSSILEPARRAWRQLILMEDAVMIYRIVRSPERRVFYVDVGNIDPNDVPKFMEKAKQQLKGNFVVDSSTGRVDKRYNPLSTDEDYFIPVRGGTDNASRIETLAGGQFTGDIEDLQYIQNKLFAALKIPKSYLGYEADVGGKATLSQQDIRFAGSIQRIQRTFIAELNKIALIHIYSMGFRGEECLNFNITMANPSAVAEIQRLELWRTKFEIAAIAQEGAFDSDWVYKNIYRLSEDDIEGIREGKKKDALFAKEVEQIATGDIPVAPDAAPPADDQAQDPDQPEEAPPEEPQETPINASKENVEGRDPHQQKAIPNELLGTGAEKNNKLEKIPDLYNHVFNTKKNALGDPGDVARLRRVASAPFGESSDPEDTLFRKNVAFLQVLMENLKESEKIVNHTSEIIVEDVKK